MPKRANPMAVKAAIVYSTQEASAALDVSPATIRAWVKRGLRTMNSKKPMLFLGQDIREFLREIRNSDKSKLRDDQLYCLSCRAGQSPTRLHVVYIPLTKKTGILKGRCPLCGTFCNRIIATSSKSKFSEIFEFKTSLGSEA